MSDTVKLKIGTKKLRAKVPDSGQVFLEQSNLAKELAEQKKLELERQKAEELEHEFQRRYKEGYEKGLAEQKMELEEQFNGELLEKSKEYYTILTDFENKFIEYEQSFREIIIEVALKISEKIIKREVENKTIIDMTLQEASSKVLGANNVILKINPVELKFLQEDEKLKQLEQKFTKIRIEEDENISIGGCLIETELGNVDARIGTQIDEIANQLEINFLEKNELD